MLRLTTTPTRREWLRLGGLGGLAWLAGPLRGLVGGASSSSPGFGRARSVLVVFTPGGQSQLDTWDPKPDAPEEIRGAFGTISTPLPGVRVCEHLPRTARLLDRCTLVRCASHQDVDHGSAIYLSLTGHYHAKRSGNPPPSPEDLPFIGSLIQRVRPERKRFPAAAVTVNGPVLVPETPAPGQFPGLLGRAYEPLALGDPGATALSLPGLQPESDLPAERQQDRRRLLERLDSATRNLERDQQALLDQDELVRQAYTLLSAPQVRRAFELEREPDAVHERYGRFRSAQALLLSRRLIEAGVPFLTVFWNHNIRGQDKSTGADAYGWDTHNDIFESLRQPLLPRFDQSFSALLEDLDQRGLLKTTLVLCIGEFGRAPLVAREANFAGDTPGRKHWAGVYSFLAAGAGVRRGAVLGASDRHGAYPQSPSVGPWDVAATCFSALGIDPAGHTYDPNGRLVVLSEGKPIAGLYTGE